MKILVLVLMVCSTFLHVNAQDSLEGYWATGEDNTIVQTYEKDGAWYGKMVSSDNPNTKLGTDILREF